MWLYIMTKCMAGAAVGRFCTESLQPSAARAVHTGTHKLPTHLSSPWTLTVWYPTGGCALENKWIPRSSNLFIHRIFSMITECDQYNEIQDGDVDGQRLVLHCRVGVQDWCRSVPLVRLYTGSTHLLGVLLEFLCSNNNSRGSSRDV